jgi:DNA-directed RNA polymerase alpha subunit
MERHGPRKHRTRTPSDPEWKKFFSEEDEDRQREEVLNTSLADTGLSVRTTNTLEGEGIFFVRDLAKQDRETLLGIGNVGESTLQECKEVMKGLGVGHPNWNKKRKVRRKKATKKKVKKGRKTQG